MDALKLLVLAMFAIALPATAGHDSRWGYSLEVFGPVDATIVVGGDHFIRCDSEVQIEVGGDNHCLTGEGLA